MPYPRIEPLSILVVQSKASEIQIRRARETSLVTLARLCAALPEATALATSYSGLKDELAPFLDGATSMDREWAVAKIRTEFSVYARLKDRTGPFAEISHDAFTALLLQIHRRLGKGADSFRNGPVVIRPDRAGNSILFPHHSQVASLIGMLHDFLCRHAAEYPALSATIAYAAVVHAHPFADGNGRTARTLYNLVLAAGTGTRHFVPIHMISMLDRGSFLIKLRRALYLGKWEELQAFFTDACRLSCRLQRGGIDSGPAEAGQNSIVPDLVSRKPKRRSLSSH